MLAIHDHPGCFSDRWIEFCEVNKIPYIKVSIYSNDIIQQLRKENVQCLLFNMFDHSLSRTRLAVRAVIKAAQDMGVLVFPNYDSYWHCDDKVAQKYLMETYNLPICPTYIFYDPDVALEWAAKTTYPKVFKLRCGAGSSNVMLVRSRNQAEWLIRKMFGRGISALPKLLSDVRTKLFKHEQQRDWISMIGRLPSTIINLWRARRDSGRERGYVYFQDYLPQNTFDTRVTVIGKRAFAFRRLVRPKDFRASGSGRIDWDPAAIDFRCLRLGFEAARKIGAHCLAFDFISDEGGNPVLIEMCYDFVAQAVYACPGYWDVWLNFHKGHMWPQDAIISDMIAAVAKKVKNISLRVQNKC